MADDPFQDENTNPGTDIDGMKPQNGESIINPQPEDNAPPFSPPDSPVGETAVDPESAASQAPLDDTHPATDSNVDSHETYDEGLSGAAEAEEPDA